MKTSFDPRRGHDYLPAPWIVLTSSSSAAATPAARPRRPRRAVGARTLLLTHNSRPSARCPAIPAIGGLGKGHLVREIDALDGLMGRATDRAGIQFRLLNRAQGPGRARPPRPGRPQALSPGHAGRCWPSSRTSRSGPAAVEDLIIDGRPASPAFVGATAARSWLRRGGADHRHLPQRPDPYRRRDDRRPAASARRRPSACRRPSTAWACPWAG